jgi:hypothetical protein
MILYDLKYEHHGSISWIFGLSVFRHEIILHAARLPRRPVDVHRPRAYGRRL